MPVSWCHFLMLLVLTETNAFSMNDHSFNTGVLPDSCAEKPSKAWSANHVIQHHHIYKWLWLEMTSQRTHGWETQILDILRCYIYIYTYIYMHILYVCISFTIFSRACLTIGYSKVQWIESQCSFSFLGSLHFQTHPHVIFLAIFLAIFYQKHLKIASHKDP